MSQEETAYDVAVIVLNWNRLDCTTACYHSLQQQACRDRQRIVIVDNASTLNKELELKTACPLAHVIRLNENRGFAGGMNAGIRAVMEKDSPAFVWLLNNDIICEPDALSGLLQTAEQNPDAGLIGSRLREGVSGDDRLVEAGRRLRLPFYVPTEIASGHLPDYLCGASLLIRCELIRQIGLLDEQFFFFFEDADYSRRALAAGWRLAVAPDPRMRHLGGGTIGALSAMQAEVYRAGHIRYLRKHARHPFLPALSSLSWRLLNDAARGRTAAFRGSLAGWRKGWQQTIWEPSKVL